VLWNHLTAIFWVVMTARNEQHSVCMCVDWRVFFITVAIAAVATAIIIRTVIASVIVWGSFRFFGI
jgi:hypothetical protein